jgi:hypothetical protein
MADAVAKTTKASSVRKSVPKPGRKASFKEAQKEIIAKFGPAFEKLSK